MLISPIKYCDMEARGARQVTFGAWGNPAARAGGDAWAERFNFQHAAALRLWPRDFTPSLRPLRWEWHGLA